MSSQIESKTNQWSKYSFRIALILSSKPMLLLLAEAGAVRTTNGLFALAIPASVLSALVLTLLALLVAGMTLVCYVFWRTNQEVEVPSPWPLFMCIGLVGVLGSIVILTKTHDALHFLLFVLFGYASYRWLRATQQVWLS